MNITPELSRLIDLLAEAGMHLLLAAHGTKPGTAERERELTACERITKKARESAEAIGGFEMLPHALAVALRACELGPAKIRAAVTVEKP